MMPVQRTPSAFRAQRGIAIITAMLVVALGTIVITSINSRQHLDMQREQNEGLIQQARNLAVSGERFAAVLLLRDKVDGLREGTDSLDDDWAQTIPPIPVDAASIKGCIVDMQGRFNLNNLVSGPGVGGGKSGARSQAHVDQLTRLMTALSIEPTKTAAIIDWLDADLDTTGAEGAENDYYTSLDPGYRAANRPMVSISELSLVKGFSAQSEQGVEDFERLLPHVTVLPLRAQATPINVNTATPEVIGSLSDEFEAKKVDISRWETLAYEDYPECEDIFDLSAEAPEGGLGENEDKSAFESTDEVRALVGAQEAQAGAQSEGQAEPSQALWGLTSDYFQVRIDVGTEGITLSQYTLFERDDQGRSRVIVRSRDAL